MTGEDEIYAEEWVRDWGGGEAIRSLQTHTMVVVSTMTRMRTSLVEFRTCGQ
jgi:hypothetical protein